MLLSVWEYQLLIITIVTTLNAAFNEMVFFYPCGMAGHAAGDVPVSAGAGLFPDIHVTILSGLSGGAPGITH